MSKGTFKISGEKFAALWRGQKSREKIAEELKISPSSVTSYSRPGIHSIHITKVEEWPDEIRTRIGANCSADAGPAQPSGIRQSEQTPASRVTLYRSVPASRPDFRELIADGEVDVSPGRADRFAAILEGDCMNPPYPNGATVLFEPREGSEVIQDGGSYLVTLKTGEVTFKQLVVAARDRQHVTLRCRNPDRERYPDRRLRRDEIRSVARAVSMWVDPEAA